MMQIFDVSDQSEYNFKCPHCSQKYRVEFYAGEHSYYKEFNCYSCDSLLELIVEARTVLDFLIKKTNE